MPRYPLYPIVNDQYGQIADTNQAYRKLDAVVDIVADYGADPNFGTDATTILSNAIEKVKSAGGGEVLIPEGIFKISNWKVLDGTHAGVTIRGLGPKSILKVALPDAPQGGRGRPPCSLLRRI